MIKVNQALRIILNSVKTIDSQCVSLLDAPSRVLSEDIYAGENIPAFDNSAMDGYALRAKDTIGASRLRPKVLEVIVDLKAGDFTEKKLKPGESARIMTGAALPQGADAVIMVEDTKAKSEIRNPKSETNLKSKIQNSKQQRKEFIEIFRKMKPGENIRRRGEDIKKGGLVIRKGTLLNSAHIGILASLGKARIKVAQEPKVAVLATGDELVDAAARLTRGKIRSSNTYTLFSQVLKCGGRPDNLGIAKDSIAQLEDKIRQGLACDIILTSGGVSMGDYDLVKDVLGKMGTNIRFWKVAMRPGKPLVFGVISATKSGGKRIPVFGLPGNPVSSMVVFEIFVRPAILKMSGQKYIDGEKEVQAVVEEDINKKPGLRYFLRANTRWDKGVYSTRTTGPQGSGILRSMALANSLIILPEDKEFVNRGERVTVRFLN